MANTNIFGAGTLAIGATASPTDQVECQVSEFTISSSANLIPIPATLCTGPTQSAQPSTFSVALEYAQDWGEAVSLSEILNTADGTILFFEYKPNDTARPTATGSFYSVAGDYGGAGQGLWTSAEALPMTGKPIYTPQV